MLSTFNWLGSLRYLLLLVEREREREREREEAILRCVYVSTTAWLPGVLARCVLGAVPPCKSYNHHFNRL